MKDGQKIKIGGSHDTSIPIQELQASKLGDAQGIPFFMNKNIRFLSKHYIFIPSHDMCYSWSVIFLYFSLVLFSFCNKWLDPSTLVWRETRSIFIA